MLYSEYEKALNVILSCKTRAQLAVATRYLKLVYKGKTNIPNAMLHTQFIVKAKQLEGEVEVA